MLNTKKIEDKLSSLKITKTKLCSNLGIARSTLDAILNGGDTKVSMIEAIAKELNLQIGFLFDENVIIEEYHAHGEKGMAVKHIDLVDQRDLSNANEDVNADEVLLLKNKINSLQQDLLEARAEIIRLMKEK